MEQNKNKVLEVKDLTISFKTDHGILRAVRGVSFDLHEGETLCIVGESGSGKSVSSKAIMGILPNNAIIDGGEINFEGENLLEVSEDEFYRIRGHKIGMIFQDPLSSLNPIVRIGKQITEATLLNADKCRQLYNDIITKELVAYKNCIAKAHARIKRYKDAYLEILAEEKKAKNSKDGTLTDEQKADIKNRAKEAKEKYLAVKKETNAKLKVDLVPLKNALDVKKAFAKTQVKEYKAKVKDEYLKDVATIKAEYITRTDAEAAKELKKRLADRKEEYGNSLKISKKEAKRRALEIMKEVGIPYPEQRFKQYPFEFSGGMRQRIVIAIALTEAPEILICDEPTTALDVTIQAQILELIKKIQKERHLSCIFITHDLGVVANMADRVAVMYAGKIVEYGLSTEIFFEPKHPYTWALLSSIPDVDSKERLESIPGTPPDMIYPPKGDAFAARSRYAMKIDYEAQPPYFKLSDTHYAATWLLHEDAPKVEMPKIVSERIRIALEGQKKNEKGGTSNE